VWIPIWYICVISGFLKHFLFDFVRSSDKKADQATREWTYRKICSSFCLLVDCLVNCDVKWDDVVLCQYSWISFIFILLLRQRKSHCLVVIKSVVTIFTNMFIRFDTVCTVGIFSIQDVFVKKNCS
jgi:hypothetical protein